MQFSTLAIAAFAALTSAAVLKRAPADLCPALDTPQCCQLDVDGIAAVTCSARESKSIAAILGNDHALLTQRNSRVRSHHRRCFRGLVPDHWSYSHVLHSPCGMLLLSPAIRDNRC